MVFSRVCILAGVPCDPMGVLQDSSLKMNGPGQFLLHPDDLHGLCKREAPNRWLVAFFYKRGWNDCRTKDAKIVVPTEVSLGLESWKRHIKLLIQAGQTTESVLEALPGLSWQENTR